MPYSSPLPDPIIEPIVKMALTEDLGRAGDVTTMATIAPTTLADWVMRARQQGIIAGLDAAILTLKLIDPSAAFKVVSPDGSVVAAGDTIARIKGKAQSLLTAERVMLNFVGQLSGIATLTAKFVAETKGTKAKIACTRKTSSVLPAA